MNDSINESIWNVADERAHEMVDHVTDSFDQYMEDESVERDEKNWASFYDAKLRDYPESDDERHFMNFFFGQMVVLHNRQSNPLEELMRQMTED